MTQAEIADLIEQGYKHPQVREEHGYFFFQTGQRTADDKPIFLCNALGAAFVAHYGLETAWQRWSEFAGSATDLLRDEMKLPWMLISHVFHDHNSTEGSLNLVLAKLRANQYRE